MTAGPAPTPPAAAALARAEKRWWLPAIMGVLSIVVGIAALVFPEPTLVAIGILFGLFFVLWGLVSLMSGMDPDTSAVLRVLRILVGIFAVLAGTVLFFRPDESVETAAFALGFFFILSGVMQLAAGIMVDEHRVWNVIWGVVGIVAGVIVLASPRIGIVTLVLIVGFGLILQGFAQLGVAFALRRLGHEGPA